MSGSLAGAGLEGGVYAPRVTSPNSRRNLHRQIRDTRERLTSTNGIARSFDYELLRIFAQSRISSSHSWLALVVTAGALSTYISGSVVAAVGMVGVLLTHLVMVTQCRRFLNSSTIDTPLKPWHNRFVLTDLVTGVGWIAVLTGFSAGGGALADIFALIGMLVIVAVASMLSATLPMAFYAVATPLTAGMIGYLMPKDTVESAILTAMVGGTIIFFVVLANRLYATSLATLEARADKDAMIADLYQAKINSDEARRTAEMASAAKSQFLAQMSHELRTPLNAILGFSEVLKSEMYGPHAAQQYREYSNDIHGSGQHLLRLINEILDLSRIEAGKYELNEEAITLTLIVEDCVHLLAMRARNRGVNISTRLEPNLPKLWADDRAIRQIVLNLLSNAIKFTPSGGDIVLKVGWTASGGQYFTVIDTGTGIPEDEIPVVLSNFGQGTNAIKSAEQGTGLGLPIVQGLVALHNGTFRLKSRLREGTEVVITFPAERVMNIVAPIQVAPDGNLATAAH